MSARYPVQLVHAVYHHLNTRFRHNCLKAMAMVASESRCVAQDIDAAQTKGYIYPAVVAVAVACRYTAEIVGDTWNMADDAAHIDASDGETHYIADDAVGTKQCAYFRVFGSAAPDNSSAAVRRRVVHRYRPNWIKMRVFGTAAPIKAYRIKRHTAKGINPALFEDYISILPPCPRFQGCSFVARRWRSFDNCF